MKTFLAFAFFIAFIGLSSCSKDESSNPTDNPIIEESISNSLKADFSGSINSNFYSYLTMNFSDESRYSATGTSTSNVSLQVTFSKDVTKGESLSIGNKSARISVINSLAYKTYQITSGTITITDITSTAIKASFSGKTSSNPSDADYLEVKNGSLVLKK